MPHPARPGLVPGRPGPPRPRPRGCWAPRQRVHVAAGRSRGSHAVTGSRPTAEDRIRAATWFADRGFGVFSVWSADPDGTCRCPKRAACGSPGKHPIGRQGFLEHTRDPERIRTLLSAASEPNYGLVCPDGVFVLDVD